MFHRPEIFSCQNIDFGSEWINHEPNRIGGAQKNIAKLSAGLLIE